MHKIIHYRDKCIGCGVCHDMQPDLWRMSRKDGKATLVNALSKKKVYILPLTKDMESLSVEAAMACPVKVIHIV